MDCDLCFKKNKFKKVYKCGNCDIAKISLTVTLLENDLVYTVTNTGTVPLCHDVIICSKLYRKKIIIKNELLLEGDSESIMMSLNETSENFEAEIARAYIKIKDRLFIVSDLVETQLSNLNNFDNNFDNNNFVNFDNSYIDPNATLGGVVIDSNVSYIQDSTSYQIDCAMAIASASSSNATNVRFTIGYSGLINQTSIILVNNPARFSLTKDADGIHGYIPLWRKNESYCFSVIVDTSTAARPAFIPFSFKLTSDNKFSEFSNYIFDSRFGGVTY